MPTGLSINIGLNHVDPAHDEGWDGALIACEVDAQDVRDLAVARD
jgi:metacaspase-1